MFTSRLIFKFQRQRGQFFFVSANLTVHKSYASSQTNLWHVV